MKTLLLSLSLLSAPTFASVLTEVPEQNLYDHDDADPCIVERDAYSVAGGGEAIARLAAQDNFYYLYQVANDLHLKASDLYHAARTACRSYDHDHDAMIEAWLDLQYSAQRFSDEWRMRGAYYNQDYRITQALQRLQYDWNRLYQDFE